MSIWAVGHCHCVTDSSPLACNAGRSGAVTTARQNVETVHHVEVVSSTTTRLMLKQHIESERAKGLLLLSSRPTRVSTSSPSVPAYNPPRHVTRHVGHLRPCLLLLEVPLLLRLPSQRPRSKTPSHNTIYSARLFVMLTLLAHSFESALKRTTITDFQRSSLFPRRLHLPFPRPRSSRLNARHDKINNALYFPTQQAFL